jgi:hypothetical protein
MAAVTAVIFSDGEGAAMSIDYDDVTLLATRLTFTVPQSLAAPLTVNATNSQLNGGNPLTWQAPPSINPAHYTFSPQLQGVQRLLHGVIPYIDWGFSQIQFGTVGVNPVAGSTVIHVNPNT